MKFVSTVTTALSDKVNIKVITLLMLLMPVFFFCSCKKFIEVTSPINQVTSSNVFSDDQTATSTVIGLYTEMMSSNVYFMNGAMSLYPALSADELYRTSPDGSIDPFYENAIPSNSSVIGNDIWRYAYQFIYHANACLEGLSNSTQLSSATKQQLTGEVKFARAYCYFYLINLFGDVPLELSTDYKTNGILPRTLVDQVYAQITTDLKDAESKLSISYITGDHIRPNKWAASALLARVYLYMGDWKNAEQEATSVINSGSYSLSKDLTQVFLSNSAEAIWQLYPVLDNSNTAEGAIFIPASGEKPTYSLPDFLMNAFEANDKRRIFWVDSVVINNTAYYYPYKYRIANGNNKTEYNMVLRFAEEYLIRSEARAQQDELTEAIEDINVIRNRAGLPMLPFTLTKTQCLAAVMQERRVEFFAEWGHRWFDLKRTNTADAILNTEKPNWNTTDQLYPIPFNETQLNPNLAQNPGY